jgi:chemotaxis protein methyltransferase CheR
MNNFSLEISKVIQTKLGIHIGEDKIDFYLNTLKQKSTLAKKLSEEMYLDTLRENSTRSNEEWKILIKSLNISETYFLRDAGQIEILEKNILPHIIDQKRASKRIRIWSAGCSTGEEPYSIAILLAELLPFTADWNISILATDVNGYSIKQAILGEYLDWSFRGVPEDRIKKYFTQKKNIYRINDSIRNHVQFLESNLFSTNYFKEFDLILCRNVFIYFDDPSKKIILEKFEKALVDNGYLLIGHSEAAHLIPKSFEAIQYQRSMVYKKLPPKADSILPSIAKTELPAREKNQTPSPLNSIRPLAESRNWERESLARVREFADVGKVSEAEVLVQEILQTNPSSHEAWFLQGQLKEASGNWNGAIELYKKVIYLNPLFLESYLTLSSLYSLLHNTSESLKVRKAGLFCLQHNEHLKQIYKNKGYHIESLESFFSEESGIWL